MTPVSYLVETLNLGKRPLAGVSSSTQEFDDLDRAVQHHCWAVGDMVMREGMTVTDAARRDAVGDDGVMAAAVLTHDAEGGRVEILLRERPTPAP